MGSAMPCMAPALQHAIAHIVSLPPAIDWAKHKVSAAGKNVFVWVPWF
jgi:hypothetical protein